MDLVESEKLNRELKFSTQEENYINQKGSPVAPHSKQKHEAYPTSNGNSKAFYEGNAKSKSKREDTFANPRKEENKYYIGTYNQININSNINVQNINGQNMGRESFYAKGNFNSNPSEDKRGYQNQKANIKTVQLEPLGSSNKVGALYSENYYNVDSNHSTSSSMPSLNKKTLAPIGGQGKYVGKVGSTIEEEDYDN
eukprot:TRINITY_DN7910_c0_g2_i1.p2 TRINITY_DN7910_c0_g2~~TRINITY_DN7910_c0_g2_i1.p2  ORF type:complete len:197 (+),score=33.17 TRINITY_DN7910_c0_g2_i1:179-769(+)